MYVDHMDSPIGPLTICATKNHITEIKFDHIGETNPSDLTSKCIEQFNAYFNGRLTKFDIPLLPQGTEFQVRVWNELQNIEFGKTISYSDLAIRLGDLKTIRAAGTANGKNRIPIIIPCHRVIGKDGSMVGFAGGISKKEWLLKHEGVIKGEQMKIFG